MDVLTTQLATRIAQSVLSEGARLGLAPLCCAVLDRGGHVLAMIRDERASIYRPQIATAKASGCLGMGFGGRELKRRADAMPMFFDGLTAIFPNGILPVPGGVLIRSGDEIIGAVGVSGDTSDNDEVCAVTAIVAAGLSADTGDPR